MTQDLVTDGPDLFYDVISIRPEGGELCVNLGDGV